MTYTLREDRALFTQIGSEGVLFDVRANRYLPLNVTGTRVVAALKAGQPMDELVAALLAEFEVTPDVCAREVQALIDLLVSRGYVDATPVPEGA